MNVFVSKFRDMIKGIITGFDRIVFKGSILPLAHAAGAMSFCQSHGVRNKDFKRWAMEQTAAQRRASSGHVVVVLRLDHHDGCDLVACVSQLTSHLERDRPAEAEPADDVRTTGLHGPDLADVVGRDVHDLTGI